MVFIAFCLLLLTSSCIVSGDRLGEAEAYYRSGVDLQERSLDQRVDDAGDDVGRRQGEEEERVPRLEPSSRKPLVVSSASTIIAK